MAYIYSLVDTWNDSGTTYTGIGLNVSDTASASGSLLMDLQVGGSSKFKVDKAGTVTVGNQVVLGSSSAVNTTFSNNSMAMLGSGAGFQVYNGAFIGFSSTGTSVGTADVLLTRRAAASLRLGAADAAAPVAQTLGVQSVVAGTTNTAGATFTIAGSQGTGTGAGGSIVFQVAPAGSTGSAQNALADVLILSGSTRGAVFHPGALQSGGISFTGNAANFYSRSVGVLNFAQSNTLAIELNYPTLSLSSDYALAWTSSAGATGASGTKDVLLYRDNTGVLALRNGANAQTFNVYNTYTDGTNYIRSEVTGTSFYQRAAGTGLGNEGSFEIGNMTGTTNLYFRVNAGTRVWYFGGSTGHFLANSDNTYDIGASGANRPRNVYVAGTITSGGDIGWAAGALNSSGLFIAASGAFTIGSGGGARTTISSGAAGNLLIKTALSADFGLLQFGSTTSSFPALKRSNTTLQARLADDTAFAPVQGKLTTDTAYTAGTFTATGYLTLYDSAGTAYRVPCAV